MSKIYRLLLISCLGFSIQSFGQTNTSVTTAKLINTFPYTDSNITSLNGGSNVPTQTSCYASCCSTLVYKVVTPFAGSIRVDVSPFQALTGSIIAYTSTVPNPTSVADLAFLSGHPGNFCGFRDSLQLGRGYQWPQYRHVSAQGKPDEGIYYDPSQAIPAGEYYILFFNYNNQTSQGPSTVDLVFDFAPACGVGYFCDGLDVTLCDASSYTGPSGKVYTASGSYLDTVLVNGANDSIYALNLDLVNTPLDQSLVPDTAICASYTDTLETNYVSTMNLVKTDKDWVEINETAPSIAGTNRSVFTWMKKSSQVSGSSQMLVAINTSGNGNVCNLQIGTNEQLQIYDGSNAQGSGVVVTDGVWHHVGYTYDETTDSTFQYVDGVIVDKYKNSQSASANNKISIGQEFDSGSSKGNFYDGEMTEVSIWNEVLSPSEVALIMGAAIESTHPKYANLVAYYTGINSCEGISADTLVDFSVNGFHGVNSRTDILSTTTLDNIPNFNSSAQFTFSLEQNGSIIASTNPFTVATVTGGNHVAKWSRAYFTITDTFDVTCASPFISSITTNSNATCNGMSDGALTASASNGTTPYTYLWSNSVTTASATGLAAGTYTVTVTDNAGLTAINSETITEPTAVGVSIIAQTNVDCNGTSAGSVTAVGTGGTGAYTYSWSNGATDSTTSNLAAGTYTVTVTDNNGCTSTISSNITEPTALVVGVSNTSPTSNASSDGSATATGNGGTTPYTYTWNNGATSATANSLSAGTYTITLTDANGCTNSNSTTLISGASVSIALNNNVSCNGGSDGSATVSVTGGTTPYTYLWSNGSTSANISSVAAGTYTVTVSDASGSSSSPTANVTITEPTALVSSAAATTAISCNGLSDGEATASATGGTTPYTYTWNNGSISGTATSLSAGTYSITITDANGCTDSSSTTVTEPTALVVSITAQSNVSSNGGSDGSATAAGSGGTGVYTYSWNNGATTATVSSLSAGTYTVSVTDGNGCGPATTTATITEPAANLLASMAIDSNVTCNGGSDGGATASASGGSSPYTYFWSNSATTASITGVTGGTYTVTVTDNNGISATANGTITQGSAVQVSPFQITQTSCAGNDGSILVTGIGGVTPYTYNWSNSDTGSFIGGLVVGNYMVTVSDANGCTDVGSYNVTKNFSACNVVTNLRTHFIQDVSAVYRWDTVPNAKLYKVVWKVAGTNGWTNQVIKHVPNGYFPVSGLSPSTSYVWSVMVKYNSGEWSGLAEGERFTTLASPCLNPSGLTTSPVQGSQAKLNWTTAVGAKSYRIRYRAQGAGSWNQTHVSNGNSFKWITGLNTSTTYEWEIKSVCNFGNSSGNRWSATQTFTTGPNPSSGQFAFNGENQHELTIPLSVSIYPNPNQGNFKLIVEGEDLESAIIKISNLTGVSVFEGRLNTKGETTGQIEMNGLAKGVYLVSVISNSEQQFKRIIVQ